MATGCWGLSDGTGFWIGSVMSSVTGWEEAIVGKGVDGDSPQIAILLVAIAEASSSKDSCRNGNAVIGSSSSSRKFPDFSETTGSASSAKLCWPAVVSC